MRASKRIGGRGAGNLTAVVLYPGLVSECIFLFECKPQPEPEPGAALAGLGSELGLEIYQARALESQAKATASRPSRAVTSLEQFGKWWVGQEMWSMREFRN